MVWAVPCDCTEGDRTERALGERAFPNAIATATSKITKRTTKSRVFRAEQLDAWARSLAQAKLVVQRFAQEFSPVRETSEHGLLLMGRAAWARRIWPSRR